MDLEGRKNNIYYDQTGKQILVGDLMKVYHFTSGKKIHYMYQVAMMEESNDFPVMAVSDYWANKPHYRLYVAADNEQRVYKSAKIISMFDSKTERKRIKINK